MCLYLACLCNISKTCSITGSLVLYSGCGWARVARCALCLSFCLQPQCQWPMMYHCSRTAPSVSLQLGVCFSITGCRVQRPKCMCCCDTDPDQRQCRLMTPACLETACLVCMILVPHPSVPFRLCMEQLFRCMQQALQRITACLVGVWDGALQM